MLCCPLHQTEHCLLSKHNNHWKAVEGCGGMQEGSLSEDLWSTHRQDHRPKRHRHSWKGEMKASYLEKVWTEQTHDLIVMNLHSQLMGTINDIDLKYVDIMVLLCTRGFQPADMCITRSRASNYRRDTCQGSISWSMEPAWAQKCSVCFCGCALGQGVLPDPEPSEAFQYLASLSSSTWHKLGAPEPGRIYLLFCNLAILSEDLRVHDF